jgi:hypothetical protein
MLKLKTVVDGASGAGKSVLETSCSFEDFLLLQTLGTSILLDLN